MNVTWKKATGPVTGYRVYCFPGDSDEPDIIKDIDGNVESAFISGLKPETTYRVGVTSVSTGTESKQVFCDSEIRTRMFIMKFAECTYKMPLFGYTVSINK